MKKTTKQPVSLHSKKDVNKVKPFVAYLWKDKGRKWNDSFVHPTLKKAKHGSWEGDKIIKVKIIPYKKL